MHFALRKLPKTFEFAGVAKKGFFPHFMDFHGYQGKGYKGVLPFPEFYGRKTMTEEEAREFD